METLADITERFDLVEALLVYVDEPVEGIAIDLANRVRYAFRSQEIVAKAVWHWVLLPVDSEQTTVRDAFASAKQAPPAQWLSVIEDRRGPQPKLRLVEMRSDKTPPPIF